MAFTRSNPDVVIAGGGPAAAATAVALATSGISTLLLVSPRPTFRMVEAISAAAFPLFEALGLIDLVRRIGAITTGLENRWNPKNPIARQDSFVLVDRAEFARQMLESAVLRGAVVERLAQRPALVTRSDRVVVELGGQAREFDAAIDATGRMAIWSRPIKRAYQMIAEVFEGPPATGPAGLKVLRSNACWAYQIAWYDYTTTAIISRHRRSPEFSKHLPDAFGNAWRASRMIGRRAAGVQWAARPIADRIIAVGDAAIAHDPISGQGIRFALASAIAAAAVIRTWHRSPQDRTTPIDFYTNFVATERRRHLSSIRSLYREYFEDEDETVAESAVGSINQRLSPVSQEKLCFSGRVESAPLHINGFIQLGEIIRLSDGGAVRWLGGFDLLKLRNLTRLPVAASRLIQLLNTEGLSTDRSTSIINWCVTNGILSSTLSNHAA